MALRTQLRNELRSDESGSADDDNLHDEPFRSREGQTSGRHAVAGLSAGTRVGPHPRAFASACVIGAAQRLPSSSETNSWNHSTLSLAEAVARRSTRRLASAAVANNLSRASSASIFWMRGHAESTSSSERNHRTTSMASLMIGSRWFATA